MAMPFFARSALVIALFFGECCIASAQQAKSAGASPSPKPGQMQMSVVTLAVMIKDTIIALNQANITGNYSVLRDMGTPVFRENFDQAALAAVFANLRARKIDLSPAYFLSPTLTKNPEFNKDNELVLTGFFPAQPLQIRFDLRFMQLDGRWRLAGLGVDAAPATADQVSAGAPASTQAAAGQNASHDAKKTPSKAKN